VPAWAYGLICVLGPALWATLVVRVVRARDAKKAGFAAAEEPPTDYTI
jgi:hypothetical protein